MEEGRDSLHSRNAIVVDWEPTPKNIDAFFREVEEINALFERMRRADRDREPRELRVNHSNGTRDAEEIFREVDILLQPEHSQGPRKLLTIDDTHGNGSDTLDIDEVVLAVEDVIVQPSGTR